MPPKRSFTDRLQDRLWTMRALHRSIESPAPENGVAAGASISGTMAWPSACAALADGRISSKNFRQRRAVMEVVETLGPCEGRHHAGLIRRSAHAGWLEDPRLHAVASWGDPFTWPGFLLGTPRSFAPSTLRYLSHSIWLHQRGYMKPGARVVEIGVGYGGLAAINALVSGSRTRLIDLPDVERAAMAALAELGLADAAAGGDDGGPFDCLISNYAFTELSRDLQMRFIESYATRAKHGMIVSNANVFAAEIGGMDNETLVATLRTHGIEATLSDSDDLLSPADRNFGSVLISW